MIKFFKYFSFLFIISAVLFGQLGKKNIQESIEQRAKDYENIAKSIFFDLKSSSVVSSACSTCFLNL